MHFRKVSWWPANNGTSEIFNVYQMFYKEKIFQTVLTTPDCPLAHLMPSSAMKAAKVIPYSGKF